MEGPMEVVGGRLKYEIWTKSDNLIALPTQTISKLAATPLWLAVNKAQPGIVEAMISARVDVNYCETLFGRSPLWEAAWTYYWQSRADSRHDVALDSADGFATHAFYA